MKNKLILIFSTLFFSCFALIANAQTNTQTNDQTNPPQATTAPAATALNAGQILEILMVVNKHEIKTGALALKRSQNADVKDFAKLMIQDHTQNLKDAKALAQKFKIKPAPSVVSIALQAKGKAGMKNLKTVAQNQFDTTYMNAMVQGHQDVLDAIDQKLLPNASNPDVKNYLQATRDKVAQHLARAKEISAKLS